jgi:hypothetical protein
MRSDSREKEPQMNANERESGGKEPQVNASQRDPEKKPLMDADGR